MPDHRLLARAEQAFRGGDFAQAERLLHRLLRIQPRHSRGNELLAYIAGNQGDFESLRKRLLIATSSAEGSREAWYYLGVDFQRVGDYERAVDAYARALGIDPLFVEAHYDRGTALDAMRRHEEALAAYDRALAVNARHVPSWANRGAALVDLGRHEEGLASFERALELEPKHVEAWSGKGVALHYLQRHEEALSAFARASALRPGDARIEWRDALTRLALGDFAAGWSKLESRWSLQEAEPRHGGTPRWRGGVSLTGKDVLAWCEQGFGDTLQFCRYVDALSREAAGVVLEVPEPLLALMASSFPRCRVIAQGTESPPCDFQIPLMSLPMAFGTRIDTVPATIPYLRPDHAKAERWRARLGPRAASPRIGVACCGSPRTRMDRTRNVPLEKFARFAPLGQLYLIQGEARPDDEAWLRANGEAVCDLRSDLHDFEDSAALVECMDHVVSVDTALAHLAGALGKPTHIVLAWESEWRWLVGRDDTPWYPTARLFRQGRTEPWESVLARVEAALACQGSITMAPTD